MDKQRIREDARSTKGIDPSFGRFIRHSRTTNHPDSTIASMAGKIGISAVYLSNIERGIDPPPSRTIIERMAEALGESRVTLLAMAGLFDSSISMPDLVLIREKQRFACEIKMGRSNNNFKRTAHGQPTATIEAIIETITRLCNENQWCNLPVVNPEQVVADVLKALVGGEIEIQPRLQPSIQIDESNQIESDDAKEAHRG